MLSWRLPSVEFATVSSREILQAPRRTCDEAACSRTASAWTLPVRCLPQVFRQNKRADDVHDIIGFRIIVAPKRPGTRARRTATASGGEAAEEGEGLENPGTTTTKRPGDGDARRRGGSRPARSLFTVKTFPPPYRDADSRLLHDVYEVLVALFDEVPGRFKVGSRIDIDVPVLGLRCGYCSFLWPSVAWPGCSCWRRERTWLTDCMEIDVWIQQ